MLYHMRLLSLVWTFFMLNSCCERIRARYVPSKTLSPTSRTFWTHLLAALYCSINPNQRSSNLTSNFIKASEHIIKSNKSLMLVWGGSVKNPWLQTKQRISLSCTCFGLQKKSLDVIRGWSILVTPSLFYARRLNRLSCFTSVKWNCIWIMYFLTGPWCLFKSHMILQC